MEVNILLEDGTSMKGKTQIHFDHLVGELVFNTGMTGYQEVMTDPSYAGQMVLMTYPLIGNYGIRVGEEESERIQVKAFIVKEVTEEISDYTAKQDIPLIYDLDTRMLTRKIRKSGTMNCMIQCEYDKDEELDQLYTYAADKEIIDVVSCKEIIDYSGSGTKVGVLDFGVKRSIIDRLKALNCHIIQFPHDTPAKVILGYKLDVLLLSNGPGDPKWAEIGIDCCKDLAGQIPLRGICLGHQILALALGGDTYKLKFGHRGSNHPVMELETNKVFITSQNHGYGVRDEKLPEGMKVTYRNINDQSVEGIEVKALNIKSVQFHPEEGPGPEEGHIILDNWIKEIEKEDQINAIKK
ncbi:glutamine-hydrolyzing carbamoyl-phosphate synthase small subunit [Vallitalea okinawensis]|uniref:glutamine-hydrolyzing carbamoyl-phosphate synthase small subunit n=1 Tax=Vallitalea okinawensis TaxID=2078660 RepID=UPI000CFD76E5|nr:glutamine-hydrolyzing carbamoyl-phosphate synthase small subunit [Vallitalea okinawensis]